MEIKFSNVSYYKYIDNISTNIESGKITLITGPTGSGKTLLAELIDNLVKPTSGDIEVGTTLLNKNIKILNINNFRRDIGFTFQISEDSFFEETVKKEVLFAANNFSIPEPEKKLMEIIKLLEIDEDLLDRNPFTLSSGEKRKVAIASTLIYDPALLILDEPFLGLDQSSIKKLILLIRTLKKDYGKTIILIMNDIDLIYEFIDNTIILKNGRIIKQGPKYDVYSDLKYLNNHGIDIPKVELFQDIAKENPDIYLDKVDNIDDLIKAVFRSVK